MGIAACIPGATEVGPFWLERDFRVIDQPGNSTQWGSIGSIWPARSLPFPLRLLDVMFTCTGSVSLPQPHQLPPTAGVIREYYCHAA